MPEKEIGSAKAAMGPLNGSAATTNGKQGSELWGCCATARFRYIRPPGSEPLRRRQNLPTSSLPSRISAGERRDGQNKAGSQN
jgi:hypothetical protein